MVYFCEQPFTGFGHELEKAVQQSGITLCTCSFCVNAFWNSLQEFQGIGKHPRTIHHNGEVQSSLEKFLTRINSPLQKIVDWLLELLSIEETDTVEPEVFSELLSRFEAYRNMVSGSLDSLFNTCAVAGSEEVLKRVGMDLSWRDPMIFTPMVDSTILSVRQLYQQRLDQAFASLRTILNQSTRDEKIAKDITGFLDSTQNNLHRITVTEMSRIFSRAVHQQMTICGVSTVNFHLVGGCEICSEIASRNPWPISDVPIPVDGTHPYCFCFLEISKMSHTCFLDEKEEPEKIKLRNGQYQQNSTNLLSAAFRKIGNSKPEDWSRGGFPPTIMLSRKDAQALLLKRGIQIREEILPASFYNPGENILILVQESLRESPLNKKVKSENWSDFRQTFEAIRDFLETSVQSFFPGDPLQGPPPYFRTGLREAISTHLAFHLIDWTEEQIRWLKTNLPIFFVRDTPIVAQLSGILADLNKTSPPGIFMDLQKDWGSWVKDMIEAGFLPNEIDLFEDRTASPNHSEMERAISRLVAIRKISLASTTGLIVGK